MSLSCKLLSIWRTRAGALLTAGLTLFAGAMLTIGATVAHAAQATELAALTKNLSAADVKDRIAAVDGLADLGADAKTAVPSLTEALQDKSSEVRWRAARALGAIGTDDQAVSAALTAGLKDEDAQVRAYAAYALGRLGDDRPPVAGAMSTLLTDPDPMVRRAALRGLRQMRLPREVSIPLFVKTLSTADQMGMVGAIQTIAESGETAVPFLMDALKQPRAAYWACLVLAEIGPPAKAAVPDLIKLASSGEPEMRLQACMALGAIGPAASVASPLLSHLVQDDPLPGVRYAAAFAIGGIGSRDATSMAALKKATESKDKFLGIVAAAALARINPTDQAEVTTAVKMLLDGLQSDSVHVRRGSARALQDLKASSEIVGPALVAALKDKDPAVVGSCLTALASLGPPAVPQLAALLKDKDLRQRAADVLAGLGENAKAAAPELVALLDDSTLEPRFRREVQFVLGQIGPEAAAATPHLIKSLDNDSERMRNSAIFALGKIGPSAKAAIPALQKLEDSDDPLMRVGSLWALVHIQPGDAAVVGKAVPELIKSLDSEREMVRSEVARTLGQIGPPAKAALPELEKMAERDPSTAARAVAKQAIEQIRGGSPEPNQATRPADNGQRIPAGK